MSSIIGNELTTLKHESQRRHCTGDKINKQNGEPGGTRTLDPRLKRPLLYQLSYRLTQIVSHWNNRNLVRNQLLFEISCLICKSPLHLLAYRHELGGLDLVFRGARRCD